MGDVDYVNNGTIRLSAFFNRRSNHHHHHHHQYHHHHHCNHHHLAVEAQNVLEYPRRPVEVELARGEAEGVAQRQDLRCNTGLRSVAVASYGVMVSAHPARLRI